MSNRRNSKAENDSPVELNRINRQEAESETGAKDSSQSTIPDGGWGWIVVLGTFIVYTISGGIGYSFGVFVEDFVNYFQSSKSAVGAILSLMLGTTWCSGDTDLLRPGH